MAQQQPSPQTVPQKPHDPDEIVHTPTRHRARWIMGILLLVMILTTFTVGDEIVKLMTGQARSSAYAHWNRPGVGEQSISHEEWTTCLRAQGKMWAVLERPKDDSDQKERAAEFLVLGALAKDAGITVTDAELAQNILGRFGVTSVYEMSLARNRVSATEFEETLRQLMIVERYTSLMASAWNTPDVAAIEQAWKKQHQEYAFDYVVIPIDSMMHDAQAVPATDEELHTFFDGMSQPRKDTYRTKEKVALELAGLAYEGASNAALLAKFPPPTDEAEIEKQAKAYFDGVGHKRFTGKQYEDVKDKVRAEALSYGALQAWLTDMRSREDRGVAVNLGADGATLGLTLQAMPAALEMSEWMKSKPAPWMGNQTGALFFGTASEAVAGKFYPKVIVDEGGFTIAHVNTRELPVQPPFEQIADKLREDLYQKRARDFALVRLEAVRNKFGTRPEPEAGKPAPVWMPEVDEEAFTTALRTSGYEPLLRDFKERSLPNTGETPAAVDRFALTQPELYKAKAGTVLPAATDFEGKNAYLMRVRGARDPDPARMKAGEFASVSAELKRTGQAEFKQKAFSLSALESRYGLVLKDKDSPE